MHKHVSNKGEIEMRGKGFKRLRKEGNQAQKTIEQERAMILKDTTGFHIVEAYKATRTNIMFSLANTKCKKIMVTSPLLKEGKSTTTINLAISFAQTGAKVLVIDCDLRKPTIHRKLGISSPRGLSHVISGLAPLDGEDVIQKEIYPNLDVITSGHIPPNPAELLGSVDMAEVVCKLEERYEYIFFDTPPINIVTDASALIPWVSGCVIVVRQGQTQQRELKDAVAKLNFIGTKILGVVLTGAKGREGKRKYGKYSKYGEYSEYTTRVENQEEVTI